MGPVNLGVPLGVLPPAAGSDVWVVGLAEYDSAKVQTSTEFPTDDMLAGNLTHQRSLVPNNLEYTAASEVYFMDCYCCSSSSVHPTFCLPGML